MMMITMTMKMIMMITMMEVHLRSTWIHWWVVRLKGHPLWLREAHRLDHRAGRVQLLVIAVVHLLRAVRQAEAADNLVHRLKQDHQIAQAAVQPLVV